MTGLLVLGKEGGKSKKCLCVWKRERGREEEKKNRARKKVAKRECVYLCVLRANSWYRVGSEVVGCGRS